MIKWSSAGRFWLAYLVLFAASLYSVSSFAGYYVTITAKDGGGHWGIIGGASPCMLTVGMAITKVTNVSYSTQVVVTALDTSAKTWAAFTGGSSTLSAVGKYAACDTYPSGSTQPPMPAGVTDPGISSDGTVSGGTGSGGTSETPFDGLFASGVFAFFFSMVVGIWVFAKNIGLILNAVRRW